MKFAAFFRRSSLLQACVVRVASRRRMRQVLAGLAALLAGAVAFGHGDLDERIAQFEAGLILKPEDAALRLELAGVRFQHGEWQAALVQLDRVDQLAPGKYATDYLRGEALLGDGQPAAARKALDRFVVAQPGNFRALALRARAELELNDAVAGMADYRAALRAAGTPEPDLVREFSDALSACGRSDEAMQVLAAGMEKLGAVPSLVLRLLDLELAAGRFEAALARVGAMEKNAVRPEPWMARRAAVLAQAGRLAEARAAWAALITHLGALPPLERGSSAMSRLAEQAHQALAALPPLPSRTT